MNPFQQLKSHHCFDGQVIYASHHSHTTGTPMRFSVFIPPSQTTAAKFPVVYWLSGLTCTEETFMIKAGAQRMAAKLGLILVAPDTSPRGASILGEADSWDFGLGAGFYVDATTAPWNKHYRMYSYVTCELPDIIKTHFPVREGAEAIMGHSMGGHGALIIGLRNSHRFASISAFAPICAPSEVPWGQKAFRGYLGEDRNTWDNYDATQLLAAGVERNIPILVDQGLNDEFLDLQLKPQRLKAVAERVNYPLNLRMHAGYDHSYFFISTFIDDHLQFHKQHLDARRLC